MRFGEYASAYVVEVESGTVLFEKDPDIERAPASLTKMMTELLTLEALERGQLTLDEMVTVPAEVRTVGGSRVRLRPGEQVSVRDLLRAMVIASANDAAVTMADRLAGSTAAFVARMNQRASELGMSHTRYVTVHGLDPHGEPGTITNARDLTVLARELIRHPLTLETSSLASEVIRGGQVIRTTNRLLGTCSGVDGLKTGYTGAAGFCLVATAMRDNMRVISVVLGAPSNRRRFSESANLLDQAFARFHRINVIRKGQDLGFACSTVGGTPPEVRLVAGEDVSVFLPASKGQDIRLRVEAPCSVSAPVDEGRILGRLQVLVGDSLAAAAPAVAERDVRPSGILSRIGLKPTWIE